MNMLYAFLSVLLPMLTGAQFIVTLVLIKGEICPGQRGRIHRLLPVFALLWLIVALTSWYALFIVGGIAWFYSRIRTGKTRNSGPVWLLLVTDAGAFVLAAITIVQASDWVGGVVTFLVIALSGAMGAHLLLVVARSRLQAFHRLLPVVGIISAMLVILCLVPFSYHLPASELDMIVSPIIWNIALLVAALILWCWHLFVSGSVNKIQLTAACVLLLTSLTGFNVLYQQGMACNHALACVIQHAFLQ